MHRTALPPAQPPSPQQSHPAADVNSAQTEKPCIRTSAGPRGRTHWAVGAEGKSCSLCVEGGSKDLGCRSRCGREASCLPRGRERPPVCSGWGRGVGRGGGQEALGAGSLFGYSGSVKVFPVHYSCTRPCPFLQILIKPELIVGPTPYSHCALHGSLPSTSMLYCYCSLACGCFPLVCSKIAVLFILVPPAPVFVHRTPKVCPALFADRMDKCMISVDTISAAYRILSNQLFSLGEPTSLSLYGFGRSDGIWTNQGLLPFLWEPQAIGLGLLVVIFPISRESLAGRKATSQGQQDWR